MRAVKMIDVTPLRGALTLLICSKLENGGNRKLALSFKSFSSLKIKQNYKNEIPPSNCVKYTSCVKMKQY